MNLVTTETTLVEASPICEHGNFNPEDFVCRDCQMTKREAVEREGVFRPFECECWGSAEIVTEADTGGNHQGAAWILGPISVLNILRQFRRTLANEG